MGVTADLSVGLRVATMCPLDSKSIFETLAELQNLGENNQKALTYYEGMPTYCIENETSYRWKEVSVLGAGALSANYVYPPNTIVNEKDYSGRVFNFVAQSSSVSGASSDLFYIEPSVNIEIKDNPSTVEQAFHFGLVDIGSGPQNVGLIKNDFVVQSNYNIKASNSVGDEIKMYSATDGIYLGHFVVSDTTWNGYLVLNVIEAGNWDIEDVYETQKVLINVLSESGYALQLVGNTVRLLQGQQLISNLDLTPLLAGQSGATIVSGVLDPGTGQVTFTMSDASTFDVDFSALLTAEDYTTKDGTLAVKSRDIHENLFVVKAAHEFVDGGFSSADINTNWNSVNFGGFPYPSNIDFVVCRYASNYYLLVRKNTTGSKLFSNSNEVLAMSFFSRQGATRTTKKLGYFKVLSKAIVLTGLNNGWTAFPIWNKVLSNIPWSSSSGYFNEIGLVHNTQEQNAWGIVSVAYEHKSHLNKSISLPYTLTDEDFGLVLHITNTGTLSVPPLINGFECGIVRKSSSAGDIVLQGSSGASLLKPSTKNLILADQYDHGYIMANNFEVVTEPQSTEFLIFGDLEDA